MNYAVREVYVIVLMDGFTLRESSGERYLHDICLCNRENGEVFYEGLGFIYLELVNFAKSEAELGTDLDRWLYVLKNMSKMDKIPLYLRKPIFEKLFNISEYSNLSKEEKEMYDVELKRKWDRANILAYAREQGLAEGKEEVIINGWKNGLTVDQLQAITNWEKEKVSEVLKRSHLL